MSTSPQPPHDSARPGREAAARLLASLAPLAHRERVRTAVARVRALPPAEVPDLLAELADPGRHVPDTRATALICARAVPSDPAHGARLADLLVAGLTDPHGAVRAQALVALRSGRIRPSADALLTGRVTAAAREQLVVALLRTPAPLPAALTDALIDSVRATWGDREAARLLPACSPATVRRVLPGLRHALHSWLPLARRVPEVVYETVVREAESQAPAARQTWWLTAAHGPLGALAQVDPGATLDLFERVGPERLTAGLVPYLPGFVAHRPRLAARLWGQGRLVLDARTLSGKGVRRFVAAVPEDELVAAVRGAAAPAAVLAALLPALPPGRRRAVLDAVRTERGAGPALPDGSETAALPPELMRVLPARDAAHFARHALERARARGAEPIELLVLRGFLPYEAEAAALREDTRRADSGERAAAWSALVRAAGRARCPEATSEVLTELSRLRSEQDPVRQSAVGALLALRTHTFTAAAVPALERIASDALAARDLSHGTLAPLTRLAGRLLHAAGEGTDDTDGAELPAVAAWAVRTLVRADGPDVLGGGSVRFVAQALGTSPPATAARALLDAVRPVVTESLDAGDPVPALSLAKSLSSSPSPQPRWERAEPWLAEIVERIALTGERGPAERACALWLASAGPRAERVRTLLAADPSAVLLPGVVDLVARQADDLMPVLTSTPLDSPPPGRFHGPGRAAGEFPRQVLPPVRAYAHRWTDATCAAVTDWLAAGLRARAHPERSPGDELLRELAAVPGGGGLAAVREAAASAHVPTAEAALAALPGADRPGLVLPDLLARADGDRARVAVYGIGRICSHVPPSELAERFRPVLERATGTKVTSRKEIVRLAADRLPAALAGELLVAAFSAPGQHRDVRAAAVTRAARLVTLEPVEACLRAVVREGSRAERAALLRVHPFDLPALAQEPYGELVAEVCRRILTETPAPPAVPDRAGADALGARTVAEACRVLRRWALAVPTVVDAGLLPRLAIEPQSPEVVWRAALEAVVEAARDDPDAYGPLLGAVTSALLGRHVREAGAGAEARVRGRGARTAGYERGDQVARIERLESAGRVDPAGRDPRDALRRIAALAGGLERTAGQGLPAACLPVWRDAVALIAEQDASLRWAVAARTALWDPAAPATERARELRAQARAVRDRPLLAARTAVAMARRSPRVSAAALAEARDAALASGTRRFARRRGGRIPPRDGLFTGLYAVGLAADHASRAASTGGELGPALQVLRDLRAHPVPEVRDAADEALTTWERR
ncbi:hypothetical protein ACFYYB_18455 [Streptomyces sp. NPDC002886]|uniref:hypothetical protein n=1 Tax=Streptomyces sp. NPDC002886 TaxID=3364667 RepID=UPI0036C4E0F0